MGNPYAYISFFVLENIFGGNPAHDPAAWIPRGYTPKANTERMRIECRTDNAKLPLFVRIWYKRRTIGTVSSQDQRVLMLPDVRVSRTLVCVWQTLIWLLFSNQTVYKYTSTHSHAL